MCGIAGILRYNQENVDPAEIIQMISAIKHRGPDGEGTFIRDAIALAHRRLAIIDLETGKQPMCNEDQSIWLTYNGEVYNFQDLRHDLTNCGHVFSTRSDSEVILHSYEEYGADCVNYFRGMFAFGLVDFNKKQILIARDHFGIKPIYYRLGEEYFAFASEISSLLTVNDSKPKGNLKALEFYLRYSYIPAPDTIYHTIFKLPAAYSLIIKFDGQIETPKKFWDFKFESKAGLSDIEWENRAESAITESVKSHLVSDVPFGVLLSGGVDSSIVTLEMVKLLGQSVVAFSIGFDDLSFTELEYAKELTAKYGIKHRTKILGGELIQLLPELISHFCEPFGDPSILPTWAVTKYAREYVPMVLSGDGGDEVFAGYGSYVGWLEPINVEQIIKSITHSPKQGIVLILKCFRDTLKYKFLRRKEKWEEFIQFIPTNSRRKLWQDVYQYLVDIPNPIFEKNFSIPKDLSDRLSYGQRMDFMTYLPDDILPKVDMMAMYHGLEVRTPFVDRHLIEFARTLPLKQRISINRNGMAINKAILKRILEKKMSISFCNRKKQGFSPPYPKWFLKGNSAYKMLDKMLEDPNNKLCHFLKRDQVYRYLWLHNKGHDQSVKLWIILILGIWLEQHQNIEFK